MDGFVYCLDRRTSRFMSVPSSVLSQSFAEMDAYVYCPDRRTSRFMSLTGCDERHARFCLEATGFDFQRAAHVYRRDVMGVSFRERPPSREEQEKQLYPGCSLARVVGIVGGLTALGMIDGLLAQVSTSV